jgi:hypothetical protein
LKLQQTNDDMRFLRLLLPFLLLLCGCSPSGDQGHTAQPMKLAAERVDNGNTPTSDIYLVVGDEKVKVAEALACDSLPPAQYGQYDIPEEAINALGCFWAGSGDYFYALRTDEGARVYHGYVGEGMPQDEVVYTPLMAFEQGAPHFDLGPSRDELVGTYALSKEEGSHILFVGLRGDTLVGEHFVLEGILPPVNQLNMLMTGLEPVDSAVLKLEQPKMFFTSSMGEGQFVRTREGLEVWLYPDNGYLRLQKILAEDYSLPVQ